ncbi:MAG: hypothetical protein IT328_04620 [Caldilineaceae bacterium]|nr:hypothetical protein [Caldilineaceae bacterium]
MSSVSAVKTVLEADATLVALATGGIWDLNETGRMGLNRSNEATAAAFTNGMIKPCILVKLRSSNPAGDAVDEGEKVMSARDMVSVWFYQDSGLDQIDLMRERVRTLLNFKQLSGSGRCLWAGDSQPDHDIDLDANVQRSDYAVWHIRR